MWLVVCSCWRVCRCTCTVRQSPCCDICGRLIEILETSDWMTRDQRFVVQLPFQWSLKGMRDCWGAGSFFVIKTMLTFFNFGLTKPYFQMSGKWPLLSERLTMLKMVGKSSLIQSLTVLVGMWALSQVSFGAFSTSFLIPSDDIGSKLVKGVPAYKCSWTLLLVELVRLIWWGVNSI